MGAIRIALTPIAAVSVTVRDKREPLRCECCDRLLAEKAGPGTVIRCTKCKTVNRV